MVMSYCARIVQAVWHPPTKYGADPERDVALRSVASRAGVAKITAAAIEMLGMLAAHLMASLALARAVVSAQGDCAIREGR